jgi:putative SOS response-associated peptidase YedK
MCYHKAISSLKDELEARYLAKLDDLGISPTTYYHNGFDFPRTPIVTNAEPKRIQFFTWGFIPEWMKSRDSALAMRARTLNCISEEAFEKPAFKDAIRTKRCLVPCTGFFEWRWFNGGKQKYPYFVFMKEEKIFSLAGVWSEWVDRGTGEVFNTYSVLTTRANPLMAKIHNSKKRMPVILTRELEAQWLDLSLAKEEVLACCEPIDDSLLSAHTISKMITDRRVEDKNLPEVSRSFEYPELALMDA